MEEGVNSLVTVDPKPTLDSLATLGWETAARILWIKDNIPSNTLHFRSSDIHCKYCSRSRLTFSCQNCGNYSPGDNFGITPIGPKKGVKEMIEEAFGEEIRNYEVA